ncbi:hypothetical protein [Demequina aestuarii]|uniref:hypothetical protein n=1 Tax=Demequina aestuarii TaxID=327095 RepID=UPI000780A60F|nr:hypothetical protein [Demequina aestuarii]
MTESENFTYTTRTNGEVEILRDGSVALLLRGDDAEDFLAQVKNGDADQVMEAFVGDQSGTAQATGTDTHPAMEQPLDGPVPHGDGEPREADGEERPSS